MISASPVTGRRKRLVTEFFTSVACLDFCPRFRSIPDRTISFM
jgi:hypothetical protein